MVSEFLVFGCLSIFELMLGSAILAILFYPLRKAGWNNGVNRALFVAFGIVLVSPALAPAGFITVIPLPLGILLAFIRSSSDITFLLRTSWFTVPSMFVTGFIFSYIARRLFPKGEALRSPVA